MLFDSLWLSFAYVIQSDFFRKSSLLEEHTDHRKQIHPLSIPGLAIHPKLHSSWSARLLRQLLCADPSRHFGGSFEITVVRWESPFLKPQLSCIAQYSDQSFM